MGQIVEFPSNGTSGQGYLAAPDDGGPGVLVIQEWWGLVDHIKDVCDRFAAAGFTALAPDLYRGETTTEPDEAGKLMMAMDLERAAKDLVGAGTFLGARPGATEGGIGVVGFCMGGGLALWYATLAGEQVSACVPFYGIIPWEAAKPDWSSMRAAVQGHFAAQDGFASPAAVAALDAQLRGAGVEVEIHSYPDTDHAFFNDTRPEVYDPIAAQQAWERTLAFLRERVGRPA